VLLGVPTIDSKCVQLHQLARVVFIDAASRLQGRIAWTLRHISPCRTLRPALLPHVRITIHDAISSAALSHQNPEERITLTLTRSLRARSVCTYALEIVEVEKHCRALRRSQQQVGKIAH